MKKFIIPLVLLGIVVGAFLLITNINPKDAAVIELNLAHFFPATHPVEKVVVQKWIDQVDAATEGKIVVTSYPGETLLNSAEVYEGVTSGIADLGISCFSYTRGRFPLLEAFELPGIIYQNAKVASVVAWEGIKKHSPEEVQDTHLLMVFTTGPGHLFIKTPVRNLQDLQGMQIRATGLSAQTLETLGAVPVAMGQPEAYEAISRGLVKGNLSPLEVLQGWRHAEVTDYLTLTPFIYNTLFFFTMSREAWDKLTPELQETMTEVSERIFLETAAGIWDFQNKEALQWAIESTGQQVIQLDAGEEERWIELVAPVQKEFIKKMEEKDLPGEAMLQTVKELANKYNQVYGD